MSACRNCVNLEGGPETSDCVQVPGIGHKPNGSLNAIGLFPAYA
jgi:hypothetical protein